MLTIEFTEGIIVIIFPLVPASYYYIVNVKQLTSEDKTALLRQQVVFFYFQLQKNWKYRINGVQN